jgi:hypothetical protein
MLALFAAASGQQLNLFVENIFSTYLYTGTGSTQVITNNIDISTKGGLVWIKSRSAATNNNLFDTVRGATKSLHSNTTDSTVTDANSLTAFSTTGFTLGSGNTSGNEVNTSAATYAAWTFREQAKFFDIVTYTGTGANRTIAHNLGSVPGCIMVRRTDSASDWQVYHSSLANTQYTVLNSTAAVATGATRWNSTTPTSTVFSVGTDLTVNASSGTYIAYLFASNAGGYGLTNTENVISCGSYTGNASASGPTITLGYEPQWVMVKRTDTTGDWLIQDNMRSLSLTTTELLWPNLATAATASTSSSIAPTATGFQIISSGTDYNASAGNYIYMAVRRGPMKVPTDATKVFAPIARTGTGSAVTVTGIGFAPDFDYTKDRGVGYGSMVVDRLRGVPYLQTESTNEALSNAAVAGNTFFSSSMDGVRFPSNSTLNNYSADTYIDYFFKRAPGFFDVVCYTGTGIATTFNHNLGVVPELVIFKSRVGDDVTWPRTGWIIYASPIGITKYLELQSANPIGSGATSAFWTNFTSSNFSVNSSSETNGGSGNTYVTYLFANCPGVTKIGSYTGTATTKQIDCGFTAGARFVLIKRTDSAGDWYVWDSARGIVAGNDPYLLFNSAAAEVTGTDYVDTYAAGFELSSTAPAAINASGGTFIFLAIA